MKVTDILSSDPEVVSGAVVFRGTRVPVNALFENMADGMSVEEFVDSFPTVEKEQVEAVLRLVSERPECLFGIGACDHARLVSAAMKLSKMKVLVRNDDLMSEALPDLGRWWREQNDQGRQCFWWRNRQVEADHVIWELVKNKSEVRTYGVWHLISDDPNPRNGEVIRQRICVLVPFDPDVFGSGQDLEAAAPFAVRLANAISDGREAELGEGILVGGDDLTNIIHGIGRPIR